MNMKLLPAGNILMT